MDVVCEFGTVSFGAEVARISCRVARSAIGLEAADKWLCGKRLTGRLTSNSEVGQQALPGMEDAADSVTGAFDVKGFNVRPEFISFGLAFAVQSVNEHDLVAMRRRAGRIIFEKAEDLPEDVRDDEDKFDDHPDVGPRPLPNQKPLPLPDNLEALLRDEGAARPLTDLCEFGMTKKKCEQLAESVGGKTVGHFEKFTVAKPEFWHRDIKGFGEEWITKLQNAHLKLRAKWPAVDAEDRKDVEYAFSMGVLAATEKRANVHEYKLGGREAKAFELGFASVEVDEMDDVDGELDMRDDEAPDEIEVD